MVRRALLLVMDSVGIGEMPDAHEYGDHGSHTLGNIAKELGGLNIPNLVDLGLANITALPGLTAAARPKACYGKMAERSKGKDTTTGHWEMTGIILEQAFPTFPHGFPSEFISAFEERIGCKVLGNEVASGTEIIERLGAEHVRTGRPIVYTSADSVFQIAAHEDAIPLAQQMDICRIAREMLDGELRVSRVIARPFTGTEGAYQRTGNRHDFSVEPVAETLLDHLIAAGQEVAAVGKIYDIFAGRGFTRHISTQNNQDGVDKTLAYLREDFGGLIFTNLVDFDMVFGHRNNVRGYAQALEELDQRLPEIIAALKEDDLLIITADHGCDPTTSSTDHSREYVPLLVYGRQMAAGVDLGIRSTFADAGAAIADYLGIKPLQHGVSFIPQIRGK